MLSAGNLDPTFGQCPPQAELALRVVLQPDGDIVAVGSANGSTPNGIVHRLGPIYQQGPSRFKFRRGRTADVVLAAFEHPLVDESTLEALARGKT